MPHPCVVVGLVCFARDIVIYIYIMEVGDVILALRGGALEACPVSMFPVRAAYAFKTDVLEQDLIRHAKAWRIRNVGGRAVLLATQLSAMIAFGDLCGLDEPYALPSVDWMQARVIVVEGQHDVIMVTMGRSLD